MKAGLVVNQNEEIKQTW